MEFGAAGFLYLLILIPILIGAYIFLIRRKRNIVRYSDISIIKEASLKTSWFKRHGPALFLLLAISASLIALAKPEAEITMPYDRKTYIIAMDTSGSMLAEDLAPTRLRVMKNAVINFIKENTAYKAQIGLVSYDWTSYRIASPTSEGERLTVYVDSLRANGATAMGDGMLESLNLIYPSGTVFPDEEITDRNIEEVPHLYQPGENDLAVIILLSDGDYSVGIDPKQVARAAAKLGVRVYTIGLGTKDSTLNIGGQMTNVSFNEGLLKEIALTTVGEYWKAENEEALNKAYGSIATKFMLETRDIDVTYLFAALAAFLMIVAFILGTFWMSVRL